MTGGWMHTSMIQYDMHVMMNGWMDLMDRLKHMTDNWIETFDGLIHTVWQTNGWMDGWNHG